MPDSIKKKKVNVISPRSGCPMRTLDASKLRNYFNLNNYEVIDTVEGADYTIFVTCAVTKAALEDSLSVIDGIKKISGELIVMGCLPGTNEKELKMIFSGKTIMTKNINDIDEYFSDFRIKFHQVPESHLYDLELYNTFAEINDIKPHFSLLRKYGFSKLFIRQIIRQQDIQRYIRKNIGFNYSDKCYLVICSGCVNNCAYCNIKRAIGKIKSKTIKSLVKEYSTLLDHGYRNFHFIAEDLCSYGFDINSSIDQLLLALSVVDKKHIVRWSLHGLNPKWLVKNQDKIIPFIKSKKIVEVTVAVESGSDRIIELMNRKYKIMDLKNTLKSYRKINPGFRINALFFAGFPTETDEDFNKTLDFLKEMRFEDVTLKGYSELETLPSAKILPKITEETIQKRILIAEALLRKLKTPYIR